MGARRLAVTIALAVMVVAVAAFALQRSSAARAREDTPLRSGDVVFQTSSSAQSRAIGLATHSRLTHVGIVAHLKERLVVLEAEGTVKTTPLEEWIARSPRSFVARRLKDGAHVLTTEAKQKLAAEGKKHLGKPYDASFEWSDQKMYCSELVWKVVHNALGIDLGEPKPLHTFDLSSPEVKAALAQRYGKSVPENVVMISPEQIFESELLETVRDDRAP
jgi:uncharacterized protein YycO